MVEQEINVYIEPSLSVHVNKGWVESMAYKILEALSINVPTELGLVITDSGTIQQLNKTYRGNETPTDVLAFFMPSQPVQDKSMFINPPNGINHLGEVIVSYPQAMQQSKEQGHEIEYELMILIIHGIVHLLGYDHEQPADAQCMRAKEEEILGKVKYLKDAT